MASITSLFPRSSGGAQEYKQTHLGAVDLSSVVQSGQYTFGVPTSGPLRPSGTAVQDSTMAVLRSASTLSQTVVDCASGDTWVRGATGLPGAVTWVAWRKLAMENSTITVLSANAGAINLSLGSTFSLAVTAATTVSFVNAKAGAELKLEVVYTAGTISWTGVSWPNNKPPVLTPGTRHVFFFTRSSDNTKWYGSQLKDYPA